MARKKAVGTDYVPENYIENKREKNKVKKEIRVKTSKNTHWVIKITPGMLMIAIIFLISFSLVAQHVWINNLGYQVSELNKEILKVQEENEKIKFKIAALSSLDRIENVAVNELGMVYPDSIYYILSEKETMEEKTYNRYLENSLKISSVKKIKENDKESSNIWLGTVQDFFYNWLLGNRS